MTPSTGSFQLELQPREGNSNILLPEEAAFFEIVLTNRTGSPATVKLLSGNMETPQIIVADGSGRELGRFTDYDLMRRSGSNPEHKEPGGPALLTLPPGMEDRSPFNLWSFTGSLAAGRYSVSVEHEAIAGAKVRSNTAPFEIVPATVTRVCVGYAAIDQGEAVLAWMAAPAGNAQKWRLLVRRSSRRSYETLTAGANPFGEFPAGAHVAIGQAVESTPINGQGWVLATSANQATLIHHNMASPLERIGPVTLPAEEMAAIPGFPDFGRRVLALATGSAQARPVLTGFAAQDGRAAPPWSVPLSGAPVLAAAAARNEKAACILYATDDGKECRIFRLSVDPAGKIVEPEKLVRSSPRVPRALRVIAGRGAPPVFLFLESDREDPARLTYARIPFTGAARLFDPHRVGGWPTVPDPDPAQPPRPVPATAYDISQDPSGVIYIAITDNPGNLYGGRLDRGVTLIRRANDDPVSFPHIVCLRRATTIGAFRSGGMLHFVRGAVLDQQPRIR